MSIRKSLGNTAPVSPRHKSNVEEFAEIIDEVEVERSSGFIVASTKVSESGSGQIAALPSNLIGSTRYLNVPIQRDKMLAQRVDRIKAYIQDGAHLRDS